MLTTAHGTTPVGKAEDGFRRNSRPCTQIKLRFGHLPPNALRADLRRRTVPGIVRRPRLGRVRDSTEQSLGLHSRSTLPNKVGPATARRYETRRDPMEQRVMAKTATSARTLTAAGHDPSRRSRSRTRCLSASCSDSRTARDWPCCTSQTGPEACSAHSPENS